MGAVVVFVHGCGSHRAISKQVLGSGVAPDTPSLVSPCLLGGEGLDKSGSNGYVHNVQGECEPAWS